MNKQELVIQLFDIGAVKFGEFKLKSGIMSPVYFDLRVIVSYPQILKSVSDLMWQEVKDQNFDLLCGVPYTALPIATAISLEYNIPMVMRRKEIKEYGTKKIIEGVFSAGQTVLVIEDLVTSGSSVFETIEPLQFEGLKVQDVIVLLDREQGGKENVINKGKKLFSVFTITELLNILLAENKIDQTTFDNTLKFIADNQIKK